MKNKKAAKDNGFTLIEVVIAIAVIAVGMISMMSLTFSVIKGNSHSKNVTIATNIAEDKIEDLKRVGFANMTDDSGNEGEYFWQADVQNNTPGINMNTINVSVYWSPATTTSAHKVVLETIVSQ